MTSVQFLIEQLHKSPKSTTALESKASLTSPHHTVEPSNRLEKVLGGGMYLSDCSHLPYVSLVLSFLFWPQSHLLKEVKWRKGGCWLRPGFNLLGLSLAPPTSTPPPLPVLGSAGVKRNTDLSVSYLLHLQSVFCNRLDHKLGSIFPNSGVERPGYIKACVLRINPLWSKKKKRRFSLS